MDSRRSFYHLGLDLGSTTVKAVLIDQTGQVLWSRYRRHLSEGRQTLLEVLGELLDHYPAIDVTAAVTGSGGIGISRDLDLPFVQEVIASTESIQRRIPDIDVAIELGGEDAKITFFDASIDQRMNETCAGGTGAFIDQMASCLKTDPAGLDDLAKGHKMLYPIASRCGVFAKADVMPLLNEGAAREDIAASIFQAVVDQAVSGLACGRPIEGKVAFLGGPLFFLSSLRERFIDTLKLTGDSIVFPENAHYFVALGAGYASMGGAIGPLTAIVSRARQSLTASPRETGALPPLFSTPSELDEFRARHGALKAERIPLSRFRGDAYLGIDSGSTTIKAVLIDESGNLLYEDYRPNHGNPLLGAIEILTEIYRRLPEGVAIAGAGVTGYGGSLLKAALKADLEEVETVAHFKGVRFFLPEVSFILDIGGQDMKCLHIKDGVIDRIMLNEACSAGCGSFIQTFANSVGASLPDFVAAALTASRPVDLGSRCTVFMNSKVKQAQKEGASLGDIAAGLSYSVVRNALYKVIKIRSIDELGDAIVVQGGAFLNDALLRAFEQMTDRKVRRVDIAGLMGAFGVAKLVAETAQPGQDTTLISPEELSTLAPKTHVARCGLCTNRCLLTINRFSNGQRHVSGNRCERGAGKKTGTLAYPNLYAYKYKRLFEVYHPLPIEEAPLGLIGIPRALNLYENYPFWFTLLTALGFRVVLSSPSSKEIFNLGMNSIPSQTVCYPAKLAHGHIMDLIRRQVPTIFFPSILYEIPEHPTDNHFNCPVVTGYPELLAHNIDALSQVRFIADYFAIDDDDRLLDQLEEALAFAEKPSRRKIRAAIKEARAEMARFKQDIRAEGDRVLAWLEETGNLGIVLAGHPYHVDPEIHHGLPDLVISNGVAVLTEDSVTHRLRHLPKLRTVDQWTFHSRLYRAAAFVAVSNRLELIQTTSFGCGLDAITTDQVAEIIESHKKIYTLIKIDEGENLGAARIRIRSLLAAVADRLRRPSPPEVTVEQVISFHRKTPFTPAMKKTHTILAPQMSPIHFQFLTRVFEAEGYCMKLLPTVSAKTIEIGLRYVNNDACYPALLVIGQLVEAVLEGGYDRDKIALVLTQTGGCCRASNYIALLRKALGEAGFPNIPIISFAANSTEPTPGFKITLNMLRRALTATIIGDLLNRLSCRTRPYETVAGSTDALVAEWGNRALKLMENPSRRHLEEAVDGIVSAFSALDIVSTPKPRVGIVGEILLKYHPGANNDVIKLVEAEGGEAVVTDIADFFLYCLYDPIYRHEQLAGSWLTAQTSRFAIWFIERQRDVVRAALARHERFHAPLTIYEMAKLGSSVISLGFQAGEGWLLSAEMVEFLENGVDNILCLQPFGCLPNHISGKGVIKTLKQRYRRANIAAIDYDPGASEVNQLNRIKLMMSVAHRNLSQADSSQTASAVVTV